MNILIIQGGANPDLPSGEKMVIESEKAYLERYHNVHVEYVSNQKGILGKVSGIFWSVKNYQLVLELIQKYKPDIIHFHTIVPYLSLSVLYAAKKCNVSIVQTLHNGRWLCLEGGYYHDGHYCDGCVGGCGFKGVLKGCSHGKFISFLLFLVNFFARFNGRLYKLIDRFIAVSDFVYSQHVKAGFPEEKITVRNNSVDTNIESFQKKQTLRRTGIAYAGRVSIAKGAEVLKYLIPKMIDSPINIIGSGPDLDDLKDFCIINSYKHVIFWGKQSHEKTLDILSSVKCTIVPSQCGETFSLVAAESMALGTPVIASNLGGLSDLVTKSGGGIVVEAQKHEEFYSAIISLMDSEELLTQLGTKGRVYVQNNLNADLKGHELEKIYKDVLNEKGINSDCNV